MPTLHSPAAARAALIDGLLAGEALRPEVSDDDRRWTEEQLAGAGQPRGWDPTSIAAEWRAPLAWAGVPFAPGGDRWDVAVSADLRHPALSDDGVLKLPPVEVFTTLTSLPLKPLRVWVSWRHAVRLQMGTGVRLWLWTDRFLALNCSDCHRGGFIHGPNRGMRAVVALEPGQSQLVTW